MKKFYPLDDLSKKLIKGEVPSQKIITDIQRMVFILFSIIWEILASCELTIPLYQISLGMPCVLLIF